MEISRLSNSQNLVVLGGELCDRRGVLVGVAQQVNAGGFTGLGDIEGVCTVATGTREESTLFDFLPVVTVWSIWILCEFGGPFRRLAVEKESTSYPAVASSSA